MKLSLIAACAAVLSTSFAARADEPEVVRARFASTADRDAVESAACSFDAVSTFDGSAHAFDVRVDGWRCVETPIAQGAIPLFVRLQSGDVRRVVVEAPAPEGIDVDHLRAAVVDITGEIQRRLARLPQAVTRKPIEDVARVHVRPSIHDDVQNAEVDPFRPTQRANKGLMAGGIVLITLGSLTTLFSFVAVAANGNSPGPSLLALGGGLAGLVAGIPMLVMGGKKVPRVTAGVSPVGGGMRITF